MPLPFGHTSCCNCLFTVSHLLVLFDKRHTRTQTTQRYYSASALLSIPSSTRIQSTYRSFFFRAVAADGSAVCRPAPRSTARICMTRAPVSPHSPYTHLPRPTLLFHVTFCVFACMLQSSPTCELPKPRMAPGMGN